MEIRNIKRKALENHEPTFATKQKRYWREPLTESVGALDIGVFELVDFHFSERSVEQCSVTRREAVRTQLNDIGVCVGIVAAFSL